MISSEGTGDKTTQKEFDKWEDAMSDFDGKAGSTPSSSPPDGTRTTDPPSQSFEDECSRRGSGNGNARPVVRVSSLSKLSLHSPSQIIGTPYHDGAAGSSGRFEYPFPATTETSDTLSASLPALSSPLSTLSSPSLFSASPPTHHQSHSYSYPLPAPSAPANYSPLHPKLRSDEPPIPPGLARKLKLRGRGRSSSIGSGSEESYGSVSTAFSGDSSADLEPHLPALHKGAKSVSPVRRRTGVD